MSYFLGDASDEGDRLFGVDGFDNYSVSLILEFINQLGVGRYNDDLCIRQSWVGANNVEDFLARLI